MFLKLVYFLMCLILASAAPSSIKIVNGTDASIEDYPFMISLRSTYGGHTCGGSILTQNWILTAAHCVHETLTPAQYTIQVGRTEISRPVDESVYEIESVIIHPGYDIYNSFVKVKHLGIQRWPVQWPTCVPTHVFKGTKLEKLLANGSDLLILSFLLVHKAKIKKVDSKLFHLNDIAVFKLRRPLEFSETVQPVQLPPPCFEVQQTDPEVTLIGWGLNENEIAQTVLQQVEYYVVPNDECDRIHADTIFPQQICAAYPGGGRGQCNGDSGGPLLHKGVQIGIVSWSIKPCTIAPYPGVLTKVSHFIEFIYQNTDLDATHSSFAECD